MEGTALTSDNLIKGRSIEKRYEFYKCQTILHNKNKIFMQFYFVNKNYVHFVINARIKTVIICKNKELPDLCVQELF